MIEFSVKCASKCHFLGWTIQNGIRKVSMDYYYHHTNLPSESDPLLENKKCSDLNNPQSLNMNERQQIKENFKSVAQFWRVFVIILTPLVLVPILVQIGSPEAKCGFVILLMATYWVTEVLPLPVTALLPVVLLPLFKIMTTDDVCIKYLKESNMMFMGSMMVAIAVEHCGLHQRIALRFLLLVGTSPRLLMLGFMLPTMFLSMWISNTATTAMMVPIVNAVMDELNDKNIDTNIESRKDTYENTNKVPKSAARQSDNQRKIKVMIYLSIAYAANTGGTGTLTGTGPNLVLKGIVGTLFGRKTPLNFASWMGFAVPTMLVNIFLCWIWLQTLYMGLPGRSKSMLHFPNTDSIKTALSNKYAELGPLNFHQIAVLLNFVVLVLLWFFREPRFINGWGDLFISVEQDNCGNTRQSQVVDDATSSMLIVIILFILPSKLTFWPFVSIRSSRPSPGLLDWRTVHDRFPWGVMILFGGGFVLADASKISGLSNWVGSQLKVLDILPDYAIVLVICIMTGLVTEVTSNVATANILLPVLSELAKSIGTNPLFLMIPATVTCSYAFMLPVATPPNAIVYSASGMKTSEMMLAGSVLNVICICVNVIAVNTYGVYIFNLNEFPEWANSSSINQHC